MNHSQENRMQNIHTSDDEIRAMQAYLEDVLDKKRPKKDIWMERIRTIIFSLVLLFLINILFSVFSARSRGMTPDIFGFQFYQVESGSMEPTYEIGDILLAKKYNGKQAITVGDSITFRTLDGMTVTHRIVEITTDDNGHTAYRTKGDNPDNSVDKELVTRDRILAVIIMELSLF